MNKTLLILLAILIAFGCKKSDTASPLEVRSLDPSYGKYISEYTQKAISISSDLTVRFAGAVISDSLVGTVVDPKYYKISPKVKGSAIWKDRSTLIFDPTARLSSSTVYTMEVSLSSLYTDVPADLSTAKIAFRTVDQHLSIYFQEINYPPNDGDMITVSGSISSTDYSDAQQVEKMITAQQDGDDRDIVWTHNTSKSHQFEISGVGRKHDASNLYIHWKSKQIDDQFSGNKKIVIHPKGVFEVLSVETARGNTRKLTVHFTGPLDRTQQLDGLVQISGYTGTCRYDASGSQLKVYPQQPVTSPFNVTVSKAIRHKDGTKMKKVYSATASFEPIKPAVRTSGKGVIVPHNTEIIFPFEAINLKGATVEVFKIFQDNVLQFLQYNELSTTYGLQPVGRIIHQQEIDLISLNGESNEESYVRYALDLQKIIDPDPGAIYQVRIGFDQHHVLSYPCVESPVEVIVAAQRDGYTSIMENYRYDDYRWEDRENPCKPAYYNSDRVLSRNVLASNIGVIAKCEGDNRIHLAITDLIHVEPMSGMEVSFYDFQQQIITSATSAASGQLTIDLERTPAFAVLQKNGEYGYISLQDQRANSLSEFDVSGSSKRQGLDGMIYGERGVWRPGDTLFLNFILEDLQKKLPANHPVTMTVKDAKGRNHFTATTSAHIGHVYDFPVPTEDGSPTGNWTASVKVGGAIFQKTLKVETVKPNRLKIEFDIVASSSLAMHRGDKISISSQWLHGAPAENLQAKVDMQITTQKTTFEGYPQYTFDDPARKISPVPATVFDGKLDANGKATFSIANNKTWLAPGRLRANFNSKVFENGGNFSEDNFSINADQYASYVGINVPKSRWGSPFIMQGTPTDIPVVAVDTQGKPIAGRKLSVGIYKADWNWWYDRGYSNKYKYNTGQHIGALETEEVTTNSKGIAEYNVEFDNYGNYMVRVCDTETGHCTGELFYTGYSWRSGSQNDGPQRLAFETDKSAYMVGEIMKVSLPTNEKAKVFMSIENGSEVLQSFWIDGKAEETVIEIPTTDQMNANVYLHAHLIQPHNNGENDLPIRMYGVVPIKVVDPKSELHPEIQMAASIRPNEKYTVNISERNGKSMTYTLAIVDEGLLDLTRHQTPDPWAHFYAKQALGVKTWDIYDYVLDGYGGALDRYISIGGDGSNSLNPKSKKANRFVPVVKHIGPFSLAPGESASHTLTMPNYVGSVRTMVVARHENAYGRTDQTTPVKKPLMVLATLPRVLGPNESLDLPANVFAMDGKIKNVQVSVETSENITINGSKKENLTFQKIGDQQAYFNMTVGNKIGSAEVTVKGQGHGEEAFETVNINIRNPNPYTAKVYDAIVEPGQSTGIPYKVFGTPGTNEGVLELSNIPPMNFTSRLRYLMRYPYGCIEQTTSSIFPQLYLDVVSDLTPEQQRTASMHVHRGIERIGLFQLGNGGLSYWAGNNDVSDWGTNYAGHFLIEAKEKGYYVPESLLSGIVKYSDKIASQWSAEKITPANRHIALTQAYRLYILAKAGEPNIGSMNRLRKTEGLSATSAHLLAAAYASIGKVDVAKELVANTNLTIVPYVETGQTYGSATRDLAIMADAQRLIGNETESALLIKQISEQMNSQRWYSTQTTAYALLAIGKYLEKYDIDEMKYEYTVGNGAPISGRTEKPLIRQLMDVEGSDNYSAKIKNTSSAPLYARVIISGQLPPGIEESPVQKHLKLDVTYLTESGTIIDPSKIKQGSDFSARVTITNLQSRGRTIDEVALSQIFPSGWEIRNDRMSSISNSQNNSSYEYQDIRDDRAYTFFDIKSNQSVYTFTIKLTAAYKGRFYLSPVTVEAMYDNEIKAVSAGKWVEVTD